MQSKLKDSLFFIAFVCGHKDTTIFVITKIVMIFVSKIFRLLLCTGTKNHE